MREAEAGGGSVWGVSDRDPAGLPSAAVWKLLLPKFLAIRARMASAEKGRTTRVLILGSIGVLFWLLVYQVLFRVLMYFREVQDIGVLLAGKLLALILIGFFAILLLSNIIGALSTFFLARDLDMLVAAPVDWLRFYAAKLLETIAHSSWMVALMSIPIFAAYGVAYDGGMLYPLAALAVFIPFVVLPAVAGSALTLLLVNVFPARRTRDLLAVIAVLAAAGLVVLFRLVRPEQLARPEGFQTLVEFVAVLQTPTSPFLPSEWAQSALMSFLEGRSDVLSFYLLWSTAAAALIVGGWLHGRFYASGFSRAQESGGAARQMKRGAATLAFSRVLGMLGPTRRELLVKEVRVFFRDTTQWSQLILLGVLVVVYVFNIRYLPIQGEGVSRVMAVLIPFMNLGLSGFVIASIAARFVFPGVSLEGRTLWLLRSSPLEMRELLWSKYWVGTVPLLVLALLLTGLTNYFLGVGVFMFTLSVLTITLMTLALAAIALAFGTFFPQFDSENAAQIPTSFGGLLFMMTSVLLIGGIILLEAGPVYEYLASETRGRDLVRYDRAVLRFGGVVLICAAAVAVPLRMARRRMEMLDR